MPTVLADVFKRNVRNRIENATANAIDACRGLPCFVLRRPIRTLFRIRTMRVISTRRLTGMTDVFTSADTLINNPTALSSPSSRKSGALKSAVRSLLKRQGYYESTMILARLVEQLQQQVVELELQKEATAPDRP
jgi:hypothetical protein